MGRLRPGQRALVTGASAGIGVELARGLARRGVDLVLVARRGERLVALAADLSAKHGVDVRAVPIDLTGASAVASLCEGLERDGLAIDWLVNNAGFGLRGPVLELPLERQLRMIQLNVVALTELTGRLTPAMVARGRGGVLNVSSTAAFQPGPYLSVYYATKAFVQSFTEGLHEELRGSGVTATALCPGATATEFGTVSGIDGMRTFDRLAAPAGPVAEQGLRALERGRASVVTGALNRVGVFGTRLAPRALCRRILARFQR